MLGYIDQTAAGYRSELVWRMATARERYDPAMLTLAIVGAGPNAAGHARYYAASGRAAVVAIADPVAERARALAGEVGARAGADLGECLDDVDAVVVASPNFLHHQQALQAARAGKHLYCEKPMGRDLAQAEAIAAAVAAAGVASQVDISTRKSASLQQMALRAQAGEFGRLISVCLRRLMWIDPKSMTGWRADPAQSGGLLMEINIHKLDWMMYCWSPVDWVFARTWAAKPGHPRANDHLWVTLGFANGAHGQHDGSWVSPTDTVHRGVQGVDGGASTDEWGNQLYLSRTGVSRTTVDPGADYDLRADWLDAIAGTARATADAAWALEVMRVGEAVFTSAAPGKPVTIASAKRTAAP